MSLKKLLRATVAPKGTRLLVTPRYEHYIANHGNLLIDRKVAEFVLDELATPQRDRSNTFSASARGSCPRAQVFQFTPIKPLPRKNSDLHAIFHTGLFIHLKWQCILLDAGVLTDVEWSCTWDEYNLTGTIDGIGVPQPDQAALYDWGTSNISYEPRFGWELKSINERGFKWVCDTGPKTEHLWQIHAYMLATGLRTWSLVYENKNTQQWKEFVVAFDQNVADEVEGELKALNTYVDNKALPPVLEPCVKKQGPFKTCDFRHECLTTATWPERVLKMKRKDP